MKKKLFVNYATPARTFMFVGALLAAGYESTQDYSIADFVLSDKEPTSPRDDTPAWRRERFIKQCGNKPVFFVPHAPYGFFLFMGQMVGADARFLQLHNCPCWSYGNDCLWIPVPIRDDRLCPLPRPAIQADNGEKFIIYAASESALEGRRVGDTS